jgi:hypothetical protein
MVLNGNVYIAFAFTNQKNTFVKTLNLELDLPLLLKKVFETIYLIKKLMTHKDKLDVIFLQLLFETININIVFGHVFNHLHNCHINIIYVVDPKYGHVLPLP